MRHKLTVAEKQRQNYIQELITTEEIYNEDMSIVLQVSLGRGWAMGGGELGEEVGDGCRPRNIHGTLLSKMSQMDTV